MQRDLKWNWIVQLNHKDTSAYVEFFSPFFQTCSCVTRPSASKKLCITSNLSQLFCVISYSFRKKHLKRYKNKYRWQCKHDELKSKDCKEKWVSAAPRLRDTRLLPKSVILAVSAQKRHVLQRGRGWWSFAPDSLAQQGTFKCSGFEKNCQKLLKSSSPVEKSSNFSPGGRHSLYIWE